MKKLLAVGAIALFGAMNAQTENAVNFNGRTFITGQFNVNTSANTTDENLDFYGDKTSFTIMPTVGHFIAPTVAVGLGLGYTSTTYKVDSNNKLVESAFTVKPLVRKYWNIANNLYVFGQFDVPLEFGKAKYTEAGTTEESGKYTSFGVFVRPGLDYFLTPNWSLEATIGALGYSSKKYDGASDSESNFGVGLNFSQINFGVKYTF